MYVYVCMCVCVCEHMCLIRPACNSIAFFACSTNFRENSFGSTPLLLQLPTPSATHIYTWISR